MSRFLVWCVAMLAGLSGAVAEPGLIEVNGRTRNFVLQRPAEPGPRPTIVMLHGGGSSGEQEMQLSGLGEAAPREGFVAVFPQGVGKLWNFFPAGTENREYRRYLDRYGGLPDDVAFLKMLVAELAHREISDLTRIYLAGRSLGGVMALRLACVDASGIAAVALLISAMPGVIGADCHPSRPVPMLTINGTEDRVLPYRGERGQQGYRLWPTAQLIAFFRDLDGCGDVSKQAVLPGRARQNVVVESWTNCSAGPVIHYRIVEGGHDIPPGLNTTQVLLDFFRDKTR